MAHSSLRPGIATVCQVALGLALAAVALEDYHHAVSSPTLSPVAESVAEPLPVTVVTNRPGTAPGYLFVDPQNVVDTTPSHGPEILDNSGRVVWYRDLPAGADGRPTFAADFRTQTYRGRPVLTWWEGTADNTGLGTGVGYIADEHYRIIATIKPPQGLDLHEFQLTPQGTVLALLTPDIETADLRPIGGPADAKVINNVVEEIDIATGKVVFSWNALQHLSVTETDVPPGPAMDLFHINALSLDTDGNLLVSARSTSTLYKVNRETGEIIWRLGGRHSDFRLGLGARFAFQHDAVSEGGGVYRMFDNEARGGLVGYESRALWIKINPKDRTASFVKEQTYPPKVLSVESEGSAQSLPNGGTLVGYGAASRVTEYDRHGRVLLDMTLPDSDSTYRAYRQVWHGQPSAPPAVTVGGRTATVEWNGATEVARWRLLGGASKDTLRPVGQAAWEGWRTDVAVGGSPAYVKAEALDAAGRVIGSSPVTATGR
jgi:hypothetical protein